MHVFFKWEGVTIKLADCSLILEPAPGQLSLSFKLHFNFGTDKSFVYYLI